MKTKRLAKSLRKFIRREKARIRRQALDFKEQEKQIGELYEKLSTTKKANEESAIQENN